jgi:hypothetical protein
MAEAGDVQMAQIDIQQQGLDLIDNMEGALENAIERWLLYGESVGKALKQALAAELAHVAARCAIKALEATADGFFFLATGQFAAATQQRSPQLLIMQRLPWARVWQQKPLRPNNNRNPQAHPQPEQQPRKAHAAGMQARCIRVKKITRQLLAATRPNSK